MNKNAYIFSGESYMIKESLKWLKQTLGTQYPEINITEFKTMPKAQEIIEACAAVPFMSLKRLVIVADCTALTTKGSKDEAKMIADFIPGLPDTTVLALCTGEAPDKRRTLYSQIKKLGEIKEFLPPTRDECARFVQAKVNEQRASISAKAASALVSAAGCDYHILEGEVSKLAAYSGFGAITEEHVRECAAKSLEYNVFEIHTLLINRKTGRARELLEDILRSERPEGLVGLIARKIRDMYKIKSMAETGFTLTKAAQVMGLKSFIAEMILKESKRFTLQELREALSALADLDYGIKSGGRDAFLALPETIIKIYKL